MICDRYAPIEPKIPRKRRRQEKSAAEAFQDCNALPSAIYDMHIFPLQLLNTPFSIPISDQSIVFLKAPYPLALSPSSASRIAANPESELAPIQKQPPLRSEAKLPRIAELVQDAAMSTTSNRESIVRIDQAHLLPRVTNYWIESAGLRCITSPDRFHHGIVYQRYSV